MIRLQTFTFALLSVGLGLYGCQTDDSTEEAGDAAISQGDMDTPPASSDMGAESDAASRSTDAGDDAAAEPLDMAVHSRPNFWEDVAPVLDARCMGCHQEDGPAPFQLETYAQARMWGPAMVAATQARTMPPWLVKGDDSCGEWRHSEWLRDDELTALADWVAGGMPEGPPGSRTLPAPNRLDGTHTVSTPEFTPRRAGIEGAEFDEYRCFKVEVSDLPDGRFLTGYEVFPGNTAIVHHVIGNIVDPAARSHDDQRTNAEVMSALDAQSPGRAGWPCYSQAGEDVRVESNPLAWAPGQGPVRFAAGSGVAMAPGSVMVLQVHYNLFDEAQIGGSDTTDIALRFEDEVEHALYPLYIDYFLSGEGRQSIPAGEAAYDYRRSATFADMGIEDRLLVWGVIPHMHERGHRLNATLRAPNRDPKCMTQVDAWDFAWQRLYWYQEPIPIDPLDSWEITCTFDTRTADEPVTAGWGTRNEMCLTVLYVSR